MLWGGGPQASASRAYLGRVPRICISGISRAHLGHISVVSRLRRLVLREEYKVLERVRRLKLRDVDARPDDCDADDLARDLGDERGQLARAHLRMVHR